VRVRIIFSLKNKGADVPFHHQYLLAQIIKGLIVKGGDQSFLTCGSYNFSGLKGQTKVSRSGLHFYSSKVTLVVSTPNPNFISYLLKYLFEMPQIEVGNLILIPQEVEEEEEPIFEDFMKFVCISPLVLVEASFDEEESKQFISPETDFFSDKLYDLTMSRMEKSGCSPDQIASFFKFQLVPDKDYLLKIKQGKKKFARIYPVYDQDVKYEIRGYTFPFTLFAAAEVLEFIYTCGFGFYTEKGFGMLDTVMENQEKQTHPYEFVNIPN